MREMEKGRERKKSGGENKAFMGSTGYDSITFSIPKGKGGLLVAHKVDKHPSKKNNNQVTTACLLDLTA